MHRITRRLVGLVAISVTSLGGIACTPYATFPSDGGSVVLTPGVYPVPQLMGKGLSETYARTVGDLALVGGAMALRAGADAWVGSPRLRRKAEEG